MTRLRILGAAALALVMLAANALAQETVKETSSDAREAAREERRDVRRDSDLRVQVREAVM